MGAIWFSVATTVLAHLAFFGAFENLTALISAPYPCAKVGFNSLMSFQPFQQAIVLTHEGTSTDQMVPYFSHRFRPLQPLTVFGRDAKAEPKCKPSHAVYYAWKDSELSAFFLEGWEFSHAPFFVFLASLERFDWLAEQAGRLAGRVARASITQVQRVLFVTVSDIGNGSVSGPVCTIRARRR